MTTNPDEAYERMKRGWNAESYRPALVLNLDESADLALVNGSVKWAPGLVPGAENEGLAAGTWVEAPPRLADFDDSSWDTPANVREVVGKGLTFAWYRFTITLPEAVRGLEVADAQIWFETCADDYGEIWVDCPPFNMDYRPADAIRDNKLSQVTGYNARNRALITPSAEVGRRHVIAVLAINGPMAQPMGGVFIRYARLEICQGLAKVPI